MDKTPTAPALIRAGVYQALGGALLAGGVALFVILTNPPKPPKGTPSAGCGCGSASQSKVYG